MVQSEHMSSLEGSLKMYAWYVLLFVLAPCNLITTWKHSKSTWCRRDTKSHNSSRTFYTSIMSCNIKGRGRGRGSSCRSKGRTICWTRGLIYKDIEELIFH